jgi:hypothetical protein
VSRECTKRTDIRTKDYWFDIGCRLAVDGKTYFRGSAEKVYGIGPKAFQGVARDTQGNMLRKIGEEKL